MNNNRFKEIIWGGMTGVLLFSGIYAGLIIATSYIGNLLPASGPSIQKFFGLNNWTFAGIHTAFIIVASVGVIVGAMAGWRCPKLSQKWFAPASMIGIPAILFGWFLYTYASHVETPRSMKFIECTNRTIKVALKVPKGRHHYLVFVMPPDSTNIILGRVSISNGMSTITNFPIGSAQAKVRCDFLRAQTNCDIEITFEQQPPPSTSIWLHWLQAYKDR